MNEYLSISKQKASLSVHAIVRHSTHLHKQLLAYDSRADILAILIELRTDR